MHPLLRSVHAEIIVSAALAIAMVVVTTALHYESLRLLTRASSGRVVSHAWVVIILAALIGVHLTEVVLYAGVYAIGSKVLGLGALHGSTDRAALDFFYFAAETYSTLGYGDLIPVGSLRLVANVEALNGLLLLSCSGAFLFGVLGDGSLQQSRPQDAMESRQAVRSRKRKCGRRVRQPTTAAALSRLPDQPRHGHEASMPQSAIMQLRPVPAYDLGEDRAIIETLSSEMQMPIDKVAWIYATERAKLERTARVKAYVGVLVTRRTRAILSAGTTENDSKRAPDIGAEDTNSPLQCHPGLTLPVSVMAPAAAPPRSGRGKGRIPRSTLLPIF